MVKTEVGFVGTVASTGLSCSRSVKLLMQWAAGDVRLEMPLQSVHGGFASFSLLTVDHEKVRDFVNHA